MKNINENKEMKIFLIFIFIFFSHWGCYRFENCLKTVLITMNHLDIMQVVSMQVSAHRNNLENLHEFRKSLNCFKINLQKLF